MATPTSAPARSRNGSAGDAAGEEVGREAAGGDIHDHADDIANEAGDAIIEMVSNLNSRGTTPATAAAAPPPMATPAPAASNAHAQTNVALGTSRTTQPRPARRSRVRSAAQSAGTLLRKGISAFTSPEKQRATTLSPTTVTMGGMRLTDANGEDAMSHGYILSGIHLPSLPPPGLEPLAVTRARSLSPPPLPKNIFTVRQPKGIARGYIQATTAPLTSRSEDMARRNRLRRGFGTHHGTVRRSMQGGVPSHRVGEAQPGDGNCDDGSGDAAANAGKLALPRKGFNLWKIAEVKVLGQIHKLHAAENAFFASVMSRVAEARAERERAKEAARIAEAEAALAEMEARRAAAADAQRAEEKRRQAAMQAKLDAAAHREQREIDAAERARLQREREALERQHALALASAAAAEQQRLLDAEEAAHQRTLQMAAARASAMKKRKSLRPLPKKLPEYEAKGRKSRGEEEVEESEVMRYASETMQLGGRADYYEHVWCNRCGHTKEEVVSKEQLTTALRMVNSDLISPNQIKFCMLALDIVVDTSMGQTVFNYRMFITIAALSERVTAMDEMLAGMLDSLDFRDARALKLKIMKGRQLFYLAEGAKTSGTMSFDELENICAAGNVDMAVADDLVQAVEEDGRPEIEFLDFLTYLPMFMQVQSDITNNPLGKVDTTRRLSRKSSMFTQYGGNDDDDGRGNGGEDGGEDDGEDDGEGHGGNGGRAVVSKMSLLSEEEGEEDEG